MTSNALICSLRVWTHCIVFANITYFCALRVCTHVLPPLAVYSKSKRKVSLLPPLGLSRQPSARERTSMIAQGLHHVRLMMDHNN
jgi:hypothetical protein